MKAEQNTWAEPGSFDASPDGNSRVTDVRSAPAEEHTAIAQLRDAWGLSKYMRRESFVERE